MLTGCASLGRLRHWLILSMAGQSAWAATNNQNNLTKWIGQAKPFCVGTPAVYSPTYPQHSGTRCCDAGQEAQNGAGDGHLGVPLLQPRRNCRLERVSLACMVSTDHRLAVTQSDWHGTIHWYANRSRGDAPRASLSATTSAFKANASSQRPRSIGNVHEDVRLPPAA